MPFDLDSREFTSSNPVPVLENLNAGSGGRTGNFGLATNGSLVYLSGSSGTSGGTLALVDRDGVLEPLNVPPADYRRPRVSPDGTQVVVTSQDDVRNFIWVYDLSGDTTIRQMTFDGRNGAALWTPDGEWITFASSRDAEQPVTATTLSIYRRRADGTGVAERLTTAEEGHQHFPESYSGDGRLSFSDVVVGGATSVWTLSSEDGAEPELFVDVPESIQQGSVFSQDGNWIAYQSNESGSYEIYVQPFPPTEQKSQITQTGGRLPLWSPDGSELFFFSDSAQQLSAVDIGTSPGVTFGDPQPIPIRNSGPRNARNFDIMPDGERFVATVPVADEGAEGDEPPAAQINIILNWFEELKERVPVP